MGGLVLAGVADDAVALGAEEDGAGTEGAGDAVDALGQAGLLVGGRLVLEERTRMVRGLDDPREHDAGLLVAVARAKLRSTSCTRRDMSP